MLSLNSVCVNLDGLELIKNLSITFLPGAIVYLKGENGCGKTSLIRSIAGIKQVSSGQITFGKNNTPLEYFSRPYCTYVGHTNAIKPELTLYENLFLWAGMYKATGLIPTALHYFGLQDLKDKKCYELSAGQKQKVALGRLICCPSKMWLLDEVENNLDQEAREVLNKLIVTKADSGSIIIASSHNETAIKSALVVEL